MPILNGASNIPGMMVQFKDGGLELRQSNVGLTQSTRSILILGTAIDGPIMEPVAVDAVTAEAVFGRGVGLNGKLNGATLPEAFNQLYKAGCRDIRMMRISGSIAKATISGSSSTEEVLALKKETLGTTGGNDVIVFNVGHTDIGDVFVYANDTLISNSKYTVNSAAGTISLHKDAVSAGSFITISYGYNAVVEVKTDTYNSFSLAANDNSTSLLLSKTALFGEEIEVKVNDVLVDTFTEDAINNKITITGFKRNAIKNVSVTLSAGDTAEDITLDHTPVSLGEVLIDGVATSASIVAGKVNIPALVAPTAGDPDITYSVSIEYTYSDDEIANGDDITITYSYVDEYANTVTKQNSATLGGELFIAKADAFSQEFDLDETVAGAFKLYIDGREILDQNAYELTPNKVKVDKNKFAKGLSIEVSYEYLSSVSVEPSIDIETNFGGLLYNEATVEVKNILDEDGEIIDKEIIIQKPLSKRSVSDESPLSFKASEYTTFGDLVEAINLNVNNNVFKLSTEYPDAETINLFAKPKTNFIGGTDGTKLSKQQIFEKLSGKRNAAGELLEYGAYQLLQNYKVDFVAPLGVYADDELVGRYDNFAYELALFCGIASQVHLTHGIISVKPPKKTDLASIEAHVKKLEGYSNILYMRRYDGLFITDGEGGPFDLGGYISVLAGPELTVTSARQGQFNDTGVCQYAALLSTLKAASAPTNKKLTSVSGARFLYSVPQLNRIAAKRFVTFQQRASDNAICPTDGVTAARPGSDYSRVVNINVVRKCLDDIYQIAEPYIGEPISVVTNNALSAAIDKKLTENSDPRTGDIQTYSFQLVTNDLDKLIGDTKIELTIVPLGERRRITVVVGLKPAL